MTVSQIDASKSNILVVDDTHANLRLLTKLLTEHGYIVRPVADGQLALGSAQTAPPDLILLDIRMPGLSGYDVCKQLKEDERTRDIPVIFLSALQEVFDKIKAFSFGGVDYITKPFQAEEVLARIETHLTLRNLQKRLQKKNVQLQQEILERKQAEDALKMPEQQLRELNASKDKFFSIIAHDLRSPINSLNGLTQFVAENLDNYTFDQLKDVILLQRKTTENLSKLLENLLTWSRLQRGMIEYSPQYLNLRTIVERNVALFIGIAEQKQLILKNLIQEEMGIYADLHMLDTIVRNLLSNALKFTEPGGEVSVLARPDNVYIEVSVSDTGIGIESKHLPKIFQLGTKYKRLGTAHEKGTGLGLILCKEFVEKNGGRIWVESDVDKGSTFKFTLHQSSIERQRMWSSSY